jgi:hypothetical protein
VTVDEEIRRVDLDITKLKIQFDLYFTGATPRPPTNQRDALEKQVKELQFKVKSVGERFLYNSVLNKFNAYSELWLKGCRTKEEGAHLHPLARRAAHQSGAAGGIAGGSNGGGAMGAAARQAAVRRGPAKGAGQPPESWRISTTRKDEKALRSLYETFIAAKDQVGDRKKPSFDSFAKEIARHAATIKGRVDCEQIDFKIYSKDNKVSIKAKPLK